MALRKPADSVIFAKEELEKEFNSLEEGNWLKKAISKAIDDIKENIFCGEQIKKDRIPKDYIRNYKITNLWWYPLPDGWRLVYSIITNKSEVLATIVEYFDHKNYERKFGY